MQNKLFLLRGGKTYRTPPTAIGTSLAALQFIQNNQQTLKPTSQMNTSSTGRYSTNKNPKGYPATQYKTMRLNSCQMPPSHSRVDYSRSCKKK